MGRFENNGAQEGNVSPSVQYEMKRAKRTGWRDVIICLVIIVVALLYQESRGDRDTRAVSLRLTEEETYMTVVGADGTEHVLVFSQLESVELFTGLSDFDRGEQLSGETAKTVTSGRFRNDAYGEYALHVMNKLHNYIVVRGADGVLVFNYEADETTEVLYDYINEKLPDE